MGNNALRKKGICMKPIIAIMYDFDKTLCTRDMQEYTFIPSVGMQPHEFWEYAGKISGKEGMDNILAYMYCMIETAKKAGNPVTREALVQCGKHVEYHPGVEDWFERINSYGKEAGVQIEHYVLSSGLKEIIEGTTIAQYFKRIYACEFLYRDGQAIWPKTSVNYTNKTQFVYRINKGILDISNDKDLNRSLPDSERRVKFPNMVYIGDGLTDVPCMKLVKQGGGHSIAIYHREQKESAIPLLKHDRVDWMFEADYRKGSGLDKAMKMLIENLANENKLIDLSIKQKKQIPEEE